MKLIKLRQFKEKNSNKKGLYFTKGKSGRKTTVYRYPYHLKDNNYFLKLLTIFIEKNENETINNELESNTNYCLLNKKGEIYLTDKCTFSVLGK